MEEKFIDLQALAEKAAQLRRTANAAGVEYFTRIDLTEGEVYTLAWENRTSLRSTLLSERGQITEDEIARHLAAVAAVIENHEDAYAKGIEAMRAQVAAYDREHGRA